MNNNLEGPKNNSRRKFIIGGLATAAAAVGVTKYGGKILEKLQPDEGIEIHEGIGFIGKKINTPADSHESFPIGPKSVIGEILASMADKPETWSVEVKIDGRNLTTSVSKEQFNALVEGTGYNVVYKTAQKNQQGWVDSIAGVKVKY